jgi:hypothetical protein
MNEGSSMDDIPFMESRQIFNGWSKTQSDIPFNLKKHEISLDCSIHPLRK